MKNTFVVTKELIKEYQTIFIKHSLFSIVFTIIESFFALVGIVIIIFAAIYSKNELYLYSALIIFLTVLNYILMKVRVKRIVNLDYQRSTLLNNGKDIVASYEFTEENIIIYYEAMNGARKLSYSYLIKTIESKNIFVLIFQNKLVLPVKKDSFIDGNQEDFIKFIKSKCKIKLKNQNKIKSK